MTMKLAAGDIDLQGSEVSGESVSHELVVVITGAVDSELKLPCAVCFSLVDSILVAYSGILVEMYGAYSSQWN
ncbi:hypothetical protein L195_g008762 [Trifolium pratense]|uniref:Uncharacterized protein n=1 Tax=Trifolium pratense TaxID=57577 RepID=A0A2K3PA09_TRIPR|nr:hypothetical protein L195_g008762 [Trifolium pratense]